MRLSCSSLRPRPELFLPVKRRRKFLKKGSMMNRLLAFVLIATLGVFTIGCESKKGTTENKVQTTTTQTKDGTITDETTETTTDTTTTIPPVNDPGAGGTTTEKTTETTTETTR